MEHIHGTHHALPVLFSCIVAVAVSYTVLGLAGRMRVSEGAARSLWLLFGSCIFGLGIWSTHFLGMLAFTMTQPVAYRLLTVLISVLAAIAGSYAAFYVSGRDTHPGPGRIAGGAFLLASGIVSMHYTGMAAMEVSIAYDALPVAVSVIIALLASFAALWLSFRSGDPEGRENVWRRLESGAAMGLGIAGMHYTAMGAASFSALPGLSRQGTFVLDQPRLASFIFAVTLVTVGFSLLAVFISRQFSTKNSEIETKTQELYDKNRELLELNQNLERLVKERTSRLEKAHDEAVKAHMIKSQFLANMSHELRTPLGAIIGYSEMLGEDAAGLGLQDFADDLKRIETSGLQLLGIINDVLDISKIEAGKAELDLDDYRLESIVQDAIDTVYPLLQVNGNGFTAYPAAGAIRTDATKLRQILINLLNNANKFTENGSITFTVEAEVRDRTAGYAFRVRDTGIGIPPEQMERLFQPFVQADASTTRKYGGTGLGLAISRRYSRLLGGDITLDSMPGEGSLFICWLPAYPVAAEPGNESGQHINSERFV